MFQLIFCLSTCDEKKGLMKFSPCRFSDKYASTQTSLRPPGLNVIKLFFVFNYGDGSILIVISGICFCPSLTFVDNLG